MRAKKHHLLSHSQQLKSKTDKSMRSMHIFFNNCQKKQLRGSNAAEEWQVCGEKGLVKGWGRRALLRMSDPPVLLGFYLCACVPLKRQINEEKSAGG